MVKAWCVLALIGGMIFSGMPALALDAAEKVLDVDARPTMQELYEDCVNALALVDKGNREGFMRSTCGVFVQGMVAGYAQTSSNAEYEMPKVCDKAEMDKEKNPSTKLILISVDLARKITRHYYARVLDPNMLSLNQKPAQIALRKRITEVSAGAGIYFFLGEMVFDVCPQK